VSPREDEFWDEATPHHASDDYPELADILVERPPLEHSQRVAMLHAAEEFITVAEARAELARIQEVSDKGGAFKRSARSMAQRLRARVEARYVATCPDPVRYAPVEWMLDRIEEAEQGKVGSLHEAGPFFDTMTMKLNEHLPGSIKYVPGNNASRDWCRFRHNQRCMYPKDLDVAATQAAGKRGVDSGRPWLLLARGVAAARGVPHQSARSQLR
jgi:hypothetical protein